ncbi:MAG: protein phosphatase 2C domain-containing protein [Spirochaetaceae bacterium]|jgi:serine/threonine protein phosphatase PrpC|nr:protein phosphatase 2C domain-containing protein [Spirochaetaceae bacterium]
MNGYRSFHVTETGGSHLKHGKGCEDYAIHGDQNACSAAVVSDGHGDDNCFRSAKGAERAAKCALAGMLRFADINLPKFARTLIRTPKPPEKADFEKSLRDLVKHIVASWQVNIEEDYTADPFTEEELAKADEKHRKKYEAGQDCSKAYGATLIACAITEHYWFGIHIGDGRFTALYADGTFDQPVPWDERCYLNVTTSICDDDAIETARCYFSYHAEKAPPVVVFLCSDGVDDNYPVDANEQHLFRLYRTIALTFAEDGFYSTCNQLQDLAHSFATKGKGDDTSIAGFVDMDGIKRAAPLWRQQIAAEEAAAQNDAGGNLTLPDSLCYGGFISAPKGLTKEQ